MSDPAGILQGEGRYLRPIRLTGAGEINAQGLAAVVHDAVLKQTAM